MALLDYDRRDLGAMVRQDLEECVLLLLYFIMKEKEGIRRVCRRKAGDRCK